MGTRAFLEIYSSDRDRGLNQLEEFLKIIERTEAELSTWKASSTISQINLSPLGVSVPLEAGACRLMERIVDLYQLSSGAFDPAVGRLLDVWGVAASVGVPESKEWETARLQSGLHHLSFSPEGCRVTRLQNIRLDSSAFGKGEALERVRVSATEKESDPWLINLGGQIAVYGHPPGGHSWQIDIASPLDRQEPYATAHLVKGSLATSGNSIRSDSQGGVEVGHILDPSTGRPSLFSGSVTVWHEDALVADALSTALHVMGPEKGIEWANLYQIAVCFIRVSDSGHVQIRRNRFFDSMVSTQFGSRSVSAKIVSSGCLPDP
jgi:thiamine biosynthesis lipoprotein